MIALVLGVGRGLVEGDKQLDFDVLDQSGLVEVDQPPLLRLAASTLRSRR